MARYYKLKESSASVSGDVAGADSSRGQVFDSMISAMRWSLLFPLAVALGACQSTPRDKNWDVPLTLQTVGPAYADYALEKADTNKDKKITLVEWVNAGGDQRSFALIDQNKDGVITRTELIQISSNARFLDMSRRYVDFNKDNQLTPRDFRSPAGVRVLRLDF